jgi:hypothetical protein
MDTVEAAVSRLSAASRPSVNSSRIKQFYIFSAADYLTRPLVHVSCRFYDCPARSGSIGVRRPRSCAVGLSVGHQGAVRQCKLIVAAVTDVTDRRRRPFASAIVVGLGPQQL